MCRQRGRCPGQLLLTQCQVRAVCYGKYHPNRIGLHDARQHGSRRRYIIAFGYLRRPDASADRRLDFRVAQINTSQIQPRLTLLHARLRLKIIALCFIKIRLRDTANIRAFHPVIKFLRANQRRIRLRQLRFTNGHGGLIRIRLNREKQIAFFDQITFLEVKRRDRP